MLLQLFFIIVAAPPLANKLCTTYMLLTQSHYSFFLHHPSLDRFVLFSTSSLPFVDGSFGHQNRILRSLLMPPLAMISFVSWASMARTTSLCILSRTWCTFRDWMSYKMMSPVSDPVTMHCRDFGLLTRNVEEMQYLVFWCIGVPYVLEHLALPDNVMGQSLSWESNVPASTYLPFGLYVTCDTGGLPAANIVFKHSPVQTSQMRIKPSWLADTTQVPSRLKETAVTGSEWAGNVDTHSPLRMSQSLTVSSNDPDANKFDCGLNSVQKTKLSCPRNSIKASSVCASHRRSVLSSLAVATNGSELLDHATSLIPLECPDSVDTGWIEYGDLFSQLCDDSEVLARSHILTLPSALADAHSAASSRSFVILAGANLTLDTALLCSPNCGMHANGAGLLASPSSAA
mmetsp:Transcript_7489/g.21881  ORF Transcript_7489/g.21881 Transcript_7489/m.21881 type:complete len:402 (+) Transcript_7489:48-1253(+)